MADSPAGVESDLRVLNHYKQPKENGIAGIKKKGGFYIQYGEKLYGN